MKRALILTSALLLSSCGFTPMHAPTGSLTGGSPFQDVNIHVIDPDKIADDEGAFWLRQALVDRIGDSGTAKTLEVRPTFSRPGYGLGANDVASRYDMRVSVTYKLLDSKTGDVLDSGTVNAISTFGAPNDPYGRTQAEKTAMENVASEAADRLIMRLAAYYKNAAR